MTRISVAKKTKLKVAVNEDEEWPDCNFVNKLAFGQLNDGEEGKGGCSEELEDGGNVKGEGSDEERDGSGGEEEGGGKHKLGCEGNDEQLI